MTRVMWLAGACALSLVSACGLDSTTCSAVYYGPPVAVLEAPNGAPASASAYAGATVTVCRVTGCETVTLPTTIIPEQENQTAFAGEISGLVNVRTYASPPLEALVDFTGHPADDHYSVRAVAADGTLLFDQRYAAHYYDPEAPECGAPYLADITPE